MRPELNQLRHRHPIVRGLWTALGCLFVALGVIGALLPIMPTMIFLILAVGCFSRSSPRLEKWLLDHPRVGPALRAWRDEGAISTPSKMAACGGMALGYAVFCFGARPQLVLALLIAALLLSCATYVATRPVPSSR